MNARILTRPARPTLRPELVLTIACSIVLLSLNLTEIAQASHGDLNGIGACGTWLSTGNMSIPRRDHTATLLNNGKVLIVNWDTNIGELYDPATSSFSPTGSTLFSHLAGATATRLLNGKVLIAGGMGARSFAELYDPTSGFFDQTGMLNLPRDFHSAVLLADGRVLIAGGHFLGSATAEIYEPVTGSFSLTDSMHDDRAGAVATLLTNGKVLIAGGNSNGFCTNSAEIYDPTSGTFSNTGNMNEARCPGSQNAPVLSSGKVLIVGGLFNLSAELYDSLTGTFSFTGSLVLPQFEPTVTLLANGQVLVAGGFSAVGPITTNAAELYDPVTGTFTATTNMNVPRQEHSATLLSNGKVLVAGGFGGNTELSSAELFSIGCPQEICLQDENNGNLLQFNSTTGDYQFTDCRKGVTLTGTGKVTNDPFHCKMTLQDTGPIPKRPDRSVSVQVNRCTHTGTASIQIFSTGSKFSITDGDITNNTCDCRPAGSGVIYSNFGPGMAFDTNPLNGWTINGFLGPSIGRQAIAHQFRPAVTNTFTGAQVALTLFSGPGNVAVFLQADSNGLPGPVVEQINVTGLTVAPTIFPATSVLRPQLHGGTPYWLTVVAGGSGVLAGWNWNSIGDSSTPSNFAATQGGSPAGPWGLNSAGLTRSAFQINGSQ